MRRATAIVLIGVAMVLLSARTASAQWEWFKWIQELSGPGPFELNGITVTFLCTKSAAGKQVSMPGDEGSPAHRFLFCDKNPVNWWQVERFWGATVAVGDGKNNLTFPVGVEKLDRVQASLYQFRLVERVRPAADIGVAVGFMRFTGTPGVTVSKYVIDPYVAVRPFAARMKREDARPSNPALDFLARSLELSAGALIFVQGFRVNDFGAIGGPDFTGDPEVSWHAGLRISIVY